VIAATDIGAAEKTSVILPNYPGSFVVGEPVRGLWQAIETHLSAAFAASCRSQEKSALPRR